MSSYYKTKESVREYIHLAKDVNGQEHIDELKKHLQSTSVVLELGSGPGSDYEILSKGYRVTGSDNSEIFIHHLKNTFPKGNFILLDASTLATNERFDAIYSNKVLHHLKEDELKKSIERQKEILYSEGIICHSFWKGEGTEIFKGLFVNYHSKKDLELIFSKDFKILHLEYYAEFEKDDSILLIAQKL